MFWEVTPYHNDRADSWVGPANTEADHRTALEYAHERLESLWDDLTVGCKATVTIELCEGDCPEVDGEV